MTPSQIQELRELADALQIQADWLAEYQHHWTACEQDAKFLLQIVANVRKAYPSLRACADREERAQAGITPTLVSDCCKAYDDAAGVRADSASKPAMRAALRLAALPVEKRGVAAIERAIAAELFEDGVSGYLHSAGIETVSAAYMEGRIDALNEVRDDLERTIGDSK